MIISLIKTPSRTFEIEALMEQATGSSPIDDQNHTTQDSKLNDSTSLQLSTMVPEDNDSASGDQSQPTYMQPLTTVLVVLHLSVFVSGLVGNALVCLSVYRNKSLQTVTNYYIVNLAVADFLVILICLPPTVYWDLTLTWNFGLILCKLVLYLQVSYIETPR